MEIIFDKKKWDSFVKEPLNTKIAFSDDGVTIEKKAESAAIVRCVLDEKFEKGKFYKFTAVAEAETCSNSCSAYIMISQLDKDKNYIIRMYAENNRDNLSEKSLVFTPEENCEFIRVDIGLKGKGKAVFKKLSIEETKAPEKRECTIAATRLNGCKSREEALDKIKAAAKEAGEAGADLIIFGEVIYDFGCGLPIAETAETQDGVYCTAMKDMAKKYNTYIVINFHEKDEDERIYNTSVLIDRNGEIAGKYRKTHISFNEFENGVTAGSELPVFDTDFGRIGILICWDVYFPEPARVLAEKGAELIVISTAGNPPHRHIARAMENGVYVAVSGNGCCPKTSDRTLFASKVIDPCGEILSAVDEDGEIALAKIDLSERKKIYWLSVAASEAVPNNIFMNEKRPELYGKICE